MGVRDGLFLLDMEFQLLDCCGGEGLENDGFSGNGFYETVFFECGYCYGSRLKGEVGERARVHLKGDFGYRRETDIHSHSSLDQIKVANTNCKYFLAKLRTEIYDWILLGRCLYKRAKKEKASLFQIHFRGKMKESVI